MGSGNGFVPSGKKSLPESLLTKMNVSMRRQGPTMSDLYVLYLGMKGIPTIPDSQCELSCNVPLSARKRSSHVYRVRNRRLPWFIGFPWTIASAKPYVTISPFGQTQERPVEANLAEVQVSMFAYVTEINVMNLGNLKEGQYWLKYRLGVARQQVITWSGINAMFCIYNYVFN